MKKTIKPGLLRYEIDEQWQEKDLSPFGSQPEVRWVVHYEITLSDHNSQGKLKKSKWENFKANHGISARHNKDGALGELFGFTVCSPAFHSSPTKDFEENGDRFLVQQKFSEEDAISYLKNRLDSIGEKDVESIGTDFQKFLDTEEWDYDSSNL